MYIDIYIFGINLNEVWVLIRKVKCFLDIIFIFNIKL